MAYFGNFNDTVAQLEGGYQKIKSDPGNYNSRKQLVGTKYGISAPVYEEWIKRVPSENDMRNITKQTANIIFKRNYWDRLKADSIQSQAVAETLVDHGINAGTGAAAKIMQRVLNARFGKNLAVDGVIGPISLRAINSVDADELFVAYNAARIDFYEKINNPNWLSIWKNRVKSIASKFGIDLKKKR